MPPSAPSRTPWPRVPRASPPRAWAGSLLQRAGREVGHVDGYLDEAATAGLSLAELTD
ncbi:MULTISPECIES: hypothetical protein [Cryobacterium]|uniref:hypothetical protein n=1 Tax=Cryobacterium TaxID=69578 RepID=UPI00141B35A4|nr:MULTISPECIES: hypothetical protein [Cryobacterium]